MSGALAGEREMEVVDLTRIDNDRAQVGLREKGGKRLCALYTDPWSALGIQQSMTHSVPTQMHAQELARRVMQESGVVLLRVLLFGGEEQYVWARLFCRQGEREFTIDCRAACGIAQALRWRLPIMMDELALRASHKAAQGFRDTFGPPAGNA